MFDGLAAAPVAPVLAAFFSLLALVHGVAFARATRSRESQLRQPRYWGR